MLKLQYSPINQAWFLLWDARLGKEATVLKILQTKEEAAWYLKTETTLSPGHIAELLDG